MAGSVNSMFLGRENTNLIEFQLELDNLLERIDHLLRGHILQFDKDGNILWKEPENESYKIFNEYGVQEILRVLSMYLNRNTILSNFDEETINFKVYDFSIELTDLIFSKYEEMFYTPEGLTQDEIDESRKSKIKLYMMIVRELVDAVHSAFNRALRGGERESLRSARMVTQNEAGQMMPMVSPMQQQQQKFSVIRPSTWFKK